ELHGKKPEHERKDVLVEHYAEGGKKQKRQGQARQTAALTAKDPDNDTNPPDAGTPATGPSAPVVRRVQFPGVAIPEYAALRTQRYTYVESRGSVSSTTCAPTR